MDLATILTPERTLCGAPGQSKKRIFEMVANRLVSDQNPARIQAIIDAFMTRERLGSTGLGKGIAIPHCRLNGCDQCIGALVTLETAISFDAPDQQPVDVLFILMVPDEATSEHLDILAELAKRFSDANYCNQLRTAVNSEALYNAAVAR